MGKLKVVTINILSDMSRWEQRGPLLAQGLRALDADLVALQEVKLPLDNAQWLADQSGYAHVFLSPKSGIEARSEGVAILSRLPFERRDALALRGQQRVLQAVQVQVDGRPLLFANGHFFWQPGDSDARDAQVQAGLEWLRAWPGQPPLVLCGDFNATPDTRAIQRLSREMQSAFASIHGREPDYTCPTPLQRSPLAITKTLLGFFLLLRLRYLKMRWKGTLDYIFVDRRLQVEAAHVALNQPLPEDTRIYPSDHFGVYAEIGV